MLDFRIQTFLAVWEEKSFTKAADRLCVTQPAVSQHIKALEARFDTPLFWWVGRDLKLTEAGNLLHRWASTAQAEGVKTEALIRARGSVLPLRMGATRTIGEYVLPPLVGRYLLDYPQAEMSLAVDNTEVLLERLRAGTIDFAFIEGIFDRRDFETSRFLQDAFIAVGAPQDPLTQVPVRLSDLFARRLLIREPGSGSRLVLETALASVNATLGDFQQTLEIGNVEAIKDLVAQGLGVSFLYQRSVQKELDSGRLVRFRLEDLTVWHDYSFVRLKNSLQEPAYQQFLARLLKTESSSPGTRRTPEYPLDSKSLGR